MSSGGSPSHVPGILPGTPELSNMSLWLIRQEEIADWESVNVSSVPKGKQKKTYMQLCTSPHKMQKVN